VRTRPLQARFLALTLLLLGQLSQAQSIGVRADAGGWGVTLRDQKIDVHTIDVGLGVRGGSLSIGARSRSTLSATLLGNLIIEVGGGAEGDQVGLSLTTRGGIGPWALAGTLRAGSATETLPWTLQQAAQAPLLAPQGSGPWRWGGELSAQWRPDRSTRVSLDQAHRQSAFGVESALRLGLRRSGIASMAADPLDLSVEVTYRGFDRLLPDQASLTLHRVPRRAAESAWGIRVSDTGPGLMVSQTFDVAGTPVRLEGVWGGALAGEQSLDLRVTGQHQLDAGRLTFSLRFQSSAGLSFSMELRPLPH
jgi:hypothetical protein